MSVVTLHTLSANDIPSTNIVTLLRPFLRPLLQSTPELYEAAALCGYSTASSHSNPLTPVVCRLENLSTYQRLESAHTSCSSVAFSTASFTLQVSKVLVLNPHHYHYHYPASASSSSASAPVVVPEPAKPPFAPVDPSHLLSSAIISISLT